MAVVVPFLTIKRLSQSDEEKVEIYNAAIYKRLRIIILFKKDFDILSSVFKALVNLQLF